MTAAQKKANRYVTSAKNKAIKTAATSIIRGNAGKLLRTSVTALPVATTLSLAAMAGIAAYAATTYIITKRARNKEERAQQAYEAAQAYREARLMAAEKQGRPLSAAQLATLSRQFKAKLATITGR